MSGFDITSCHEFWKNFVNQDVYKVICLMETMEDWCLDNDPSVDQSINQMFESFENGDTSIVSQHQTLTNILAYIRMSRKLRIMQALDSIEPGSASKLISYAEENSINNEACKTFIRRNVAFERLRILNRILHKDRIDIITQSVEQA